MPQFDPETTYDIYNKDIPITDFHNYREEFVTRPPYQRKSVWSRRKQQALLDSLFRRYYIPRIVIREVRLDQDRSVNEVVDGQQRITTVQNFLSDVLPLPKSLKSVHPDLPGARYSQLPSGIRRFVDRLAFSADIVKGIADPANPNHQEIATEIFWRLQQGESLNYMEVAHSRLSSLARNFVVKYADDERFDHDTYHPIDDNPDKHPFFQIIARDNNRMQHLALTARLLMIEKANGPTDIKDTSLMEFIDEHKQPDGIGNWSMENQPVARRTLRHMQAFYDVFKDDPMVAEGDGMREFRIEYFIISTYLLLRHLVTYYVWDDAERALFRDFVLDFHSRWRSGRRENDNEILVFSDNRQQTVGEIETRDRIIRQSFFKFAQEQGRTLLTKDDRRVFNEAERIRIYRDAEGLCQMCLKEGKPEKEARVAWAQFQADHIIPHSKGGRTTLPNAQLLCRYHNQSKGASSV